VFVLNKQEAAQSKGSQKKMKSIAVCIIFASDLVHRAIRKTKAFTTLFLTSYRGSSLKSSRFSGFVFFSGLKNASATFCTCDKVPKNFQKVRQNVF
jgi:hypothetical protein